MVLLLNNYVFKNSKVTPCFNSKGLGSIVVLQRIWVINRKTGHWFWACIIQKLFEILKSISKNYKKKKLANVLQCHILFLILFTCMRKVLILCDYSFGKEVLDNMQSGKVPDSANGSSQNNSGYYLICFETLGRSAWNSYSEEQRWHPTFCLLNNPESEHSLKCQLPSSYGMTRLFIEPLRLHRVC